MPLILKKCLNFAVFGFLKQKRVASAEIKKRRYRKVVRMRMRYPNSVEIQPVYVMGIVMK